MHDFHSFRKAPSEDELELHIDAFLTALSTGDFEAAFELCPGLTWNEEAPYLDPTDESAVQKFLGHAVFGAMESQEILDGETMTAEEPATWCRFLTPPSKVDFDDVNLSAPEPGETGEVLANVHLKRVVTDITARFELRKHERGWLLAFAGFDVM